MKKMIALMALAMVAFAHAETVKMASEEWVKKLIEKKLANYSEKRIEHPKETHNWRTDVIEHSGTLKLDNGETVQVRIGFVPTTNLVMFVTDSNVSGVTNGTTYVWNSIGAWDTVQSTALPTINCYDYAADGTNSVRYYSATINGTDYHSYVYGGKTYLVPDGETLQGGTKIELAMKYVSNREYKIACGNLFETALCAPRLFSFSLFLSAFAHVKDIKEELASGNLAIGYFQYTKAGRVYEFFGDDDTEYFLDLDGNGATLRDYTVETFKMWMGDMRQTLIAERGDKIDERARDPENWGLPSILTGTDGMTITRNNLSKSDFWKETIDDIVEYCQGEHLNYFFVLYDELIKHDLPAAD